MNLETPSTLWSRTPKIPPATMGGRTRFGATSWPAAEWYLGYKHPHSDLTCQDYRTHAKMWTQERHALEFFQNHKIPFWDMTNNNAKVSVPDAYCFY